MNTAPIFSSNILDYSLEELSECLQKAGHPAFRARQIFDWIYHKGVDSFDPMKNLPRELKEYLEMNFHFGKETIAKKQVSADGTTKFLFDLADHQKVETVLIPTKNRTTVCVSTQAGCKFGCRFCASGIGGWKRNLSSGEILMQILIYLQTVKSMPRHIIFKFMELDCLKKT